jgi:hypothetical protein
MSPSTSSPPGQPRKPRHEIVEEEEEEEETEPPVTTSASKKDLIEEKDDWEETAESAKRRRRAIGDSDQDEEEDYSQPFSSAQIPRIKQRIIRRARRKGTSGQPNSARVVTASAGFGKEH